MRVYQSVQRLSNSRRSLTPVARSPLQRKCACGGASSPTGECAACRRASSMGALAKRAGVIQQAGAAERSGALSGPASGRALPGDLRVEAERRLHHAFDHVRLHDDRAGGWAAFSLGARAVTVGHHIFADRSQLTASGRALLMHELAHVAAQDPARMALTGVAPQSHPAERAARQVEAGANPVLPPAPVGIYRSPLRRADFEREMARRFGVRRVFDATFEEQVKRLNYFGAGQRPGDRLRREDWAAWSPGDESDLYDWIIAAFAAFAQRLGGVPAVEEIGFYAVDYDLNDAGALVRRPNVLATYGGGRMAIYRVATTSRFSLPTARGAAGAATPRRTLTPEQSFIAAVTHELGHGFVETALTPRTGGQPAPDPAFAREYRLAAGWTAGADPELYDAGVPEVQAALAEGRVPPAAYRITPANWNDPRWIEQPISEYMTTHPSEDIPEAIAVYVTQPDLLRDRSPRRFNFLETHKEAVQPFLRRDLATLRLRPSEADLRAIIERSTPPPWMRPVPRPQPAAPSGSRIRLRPGPVLEIRF